AFLLFLGPRGSGKSEATSYMLFRMKNKIHTCAVFCSSDTPDSIATGIIPDCFVYDAIDVACIQRIRERHKAINHTLQVTGKMPPFCKSSQVLLIADDI